MKISDDPTLPLVRAYLRQHPIAIPKSFHNQYCPAARDKSPQYVNCATPPPTPDMSWDYGFMPGNGGTLVSFGPYSEIVAGDNFRPSLRACVGQTAHSLVADATALAGTMTTAVQQWRNGPNAALIDGLLTSYAAGEIGAAAFIAGVVSLTDAATLALIVTTAGLVLWSILDVAECVTGGDTVSYQSYGSLKEA